MKSIIHNLTILLCLQLFKIIGKTQSEPTRLHTIKTKSNSDLAVIFIKPDGKIGHERIICCDRSK